MKLEEPQRFIAPRHVSTIIGLGPYEVFPNVTRMPVVVAGFEPLDLMFGSTMILKQLKEGTPNWKNEYVRAVNYDGNTKAARTNEPRILHG